MRQDLDFLKLPTLAERQEAVLEDTVKYYSEDVNRRCVIIGQICRYSGETVNKDTEGCAVGRLLTLEERNMLDGLFKRGASFETLLDKDVKEAKELSELLGKDFLSNLQRLHDNAACWNSSGLSDIGKRNIERYIKPIIGQP